VVESSDREYRNATVATAIRDALEARNARTAPVPVPAAVALAPLAGEPARSRLDLTQRLERGEYKERLAEAQQRLRKLAFKAEKRGVSTVLTFEGSDAAGKGGAIRRITQALPARLYRVVPIAAPTGDECQHHYLWRFWQRLPNAGRMVIFDRSWYGRVLVERVEGFAKDAEWQRAYAEINDFEAQLARHGAFAKFWLQIDDAEQLRRFEAREQTAYKKYKITDDDYRNRAKREQYDLAIDEMIARTDTESSPWRLVSANDKRWARVVVLESIVETLSRRL
jgi:polyphosphate kinase 2 (PPK2 family)